MHKKIIRPMNAFLNCMQKHTKILTVKNKSLAFCELDIFSVTSCQLMLGHSSSLRTHCNGRVLGGSSCGAGGSSIALFLFDQPSIISSSHNLQKILNNFKKYFLMSENKFQITNLSQAIRSKFK